MLLSAESFQFKAGHLLLAWLLIYLFAALATNHLILTDAFYYTAFAGRLTPERIESSIAFCRKYQWVVLCLLPILLSLKYLLIAGLLFSGAYLFNQRLSYTNSLKIVLVAETVWVILTLIRLAWFTIYPAGSLEAVQRFNLFSLNQLLDVRTLPAYLLYPLEQVSVTELGYWLMLAVGVRAFICRSLPYSLRMVASSYGIALGLWILCVMFLQLQFNP